MGSDRTEFISLTVREAEARNLRVVAGPFSANESGLMFSVLDGLPPGGRFVAGEWVWTVRPNPRKRKKPPPEIHRRAVERAKELAPVVAEIQQSGKTKLREIAEEFERRGIRGPRVRRWSCAAVWRLLELIRRKNLR